MPLSRRKHCRLCELGTISVPFGGVFALVFQRFPEGRKIIHNHTSAIPRPDKKQLSSLGLQAPAVSKGCRSENRVTEKGSGGAVFGKQKLHHVDVAFAEAALTPSKIEIPHAQEALVET